MKKFLALIMVLILGVSTLAACGGGSDDKKETQSKEETTNTAETPETKADQETETKAETSSNGEGLRVAAIFAGAINDGNWNETQYNGLKKLEGLGAQIMFLENIGDTEAAESARSFAEEGYDIVYLATNSMQDYCTSVAEAFPDTIFFQINGTEVTDNFISVAVADEEQGFMQGVIAALLTETGKVGFVGGLEINPIILGGKGFEQGVAYANENFGLDVEPVIIFTGSFVDVSKAKETAISLIESGCDVIAPMADDSSVGIMEAAEEKGVMAIGSGVGLETSAPTGIRVTVVKDMSMIYDATYDAFVNGTINKSEVSVFGARDGVIYLTEWFNDASDEVRSQAEDVMAKLSSGEIELDIEIN